MLLGFRGFTGHEHYDNICGIVLINMNARIYDPVNARFLRWDIATSGGTQGMNRYSYALNNPLKYTDPSGNFVMLGIGAVMAIGAAVGIITNGLNNVVNGQNFFKGAYQAAFMGAFTGFVSAGIGGIALGIANGYVAGAAQAGMHGLSGGFSSMMSGGTFRSGFASGAVSSIIAGGVGKYTKGDAVAMILAGGVSGGISAEIAGGNFWRGVGQGLITAGLNHAANHVADNISARTQATYEVTSGLMSADGKTSIIETKSKITVDVNSNAIEHSAAVQTGQYSVAGSSVATGTASVSYINGVISIDIPSNVTSIPFALGSTTLELGAAGTLNVGKAAGVEINGSIAIENNIVSGGGSFSYNANVNLNQNSGYVSYYETTYNPAPLVIASQYGNVYTAGLKPYIYVKATWTNGATNIMGYKPPNR